MGGLSGFKIRAVIKSLENKLGIGFRAGKELNGWYYLEGKKVLRVTIPKGHGGAELGCRTALRVMNSLKTSKGEFRAIYECPMSGKDFERKIREMGII